MSKRSPEEILKDIEDSEVDDEIDRVLAMSPEERRRELEAGGVDVEGLHAKADALHGQIQHAATAGPPPAKVTVLATRVRRAAWAVPLIAAALGVVFFVMSTGGGVSRGRAHGAAELRSEAYAACDAHRWRECGEKLDQAKEIDPEGESDPRVVAARKAVQEATGD
jgi:hypothetical protein